jgi:hypothetical protein
MLGIFGLIIVVGGIATLARGRGANPVLMGAIAVAGWILIEFGGSFFIPAEQDRLFLTVAAWAWTAVVAGFVRFVVGAGRPKPDGKWSCSNCNYLNNASSVICEACQQPWRAREAAAGQ